jgi:hypothetical protein
MLDRPLAGGPGLHLFLGVILDRDPLHGVMKDPGNYF